MDSSISNTICLTPRYVLHEDRQPIGPDVSEDSAGRSFVAIYGFSGKAAYDAFIANSEGDLRPYPLMKGYLRNRLAEQADETYLVIMDANGPVTASVDAATIEHVLAAQDQADAQLASDLLLTYSGSSKAYALASTVV